jgi:hypothetical protein
VLQLVFEFHERRYLERNKISEHPTGPAGIVQSAANRTELHLVPQFNGTAVQGYRDWKALRLEGTAIGRYRDWKAP